MVGLEESSPDRDRPTGFTPGALARRVRSWLPTVAYGTCCGVRVPEPAEPRKLFDGLRPGRATPEHSQFEGALVAAHREYTGPDDRVVIVGGGFGITTAVAAAHGGRVDVYEPNPERLAAIRTTLELNDVDAGDAGVTLHRAIVGELSRGEADEKGVNPDVAPTVAPAALPATDVLELDCEGAELAILRGLDEAALPRVIAVEVHPIKLDGAAPEVVPTLRTLGYTVGRRLTHDGIDISRGTFEDLLDGTTPGVGDETHQTFPPVVVAER